MKTYACHLSTIPQSESVILQATSFEKAACQFLKVPNVVKRMGRVRGGGYEFVEARGSKQSAYVRLVK